MDFKNLDLNIGVIYLITGQKPEHKYIGQTKMFRIKYSSNKYLGNKYKYFDYKGRFKEHLIAARYKPTYHIDRIIKKYGPENFSVKLVRYCFPNELDDYEVKYIKKFNTLYPNGSNIVLGNPHKNSNKERTSTLLKEYYKNIQVQLQHSLIHRSKFKDLSDKRIDRIVIKPIKENGINKILYMYIEYENNESQRRRYGGKHELWDEAYNRCMIDACNLSNNIIDYTKDQQHLGLGEITIVEIKIHTMGDKKLISLYITNTDVKKWDQKKRFVFGGKTITLKDAFNQAVNFIKINEIDANKIKIQDSLIATLPNCWNTLRA
jgi:REP element-mobilizing transposase RayT